MTEETTTATAQDATDGQAQAATTATTPPQSGQATEAGSVDALPKWAQAIIKDLRTENANRRKAEQQAEEQKRRDEEAAAAKNGEWQTVAQKAQEERDEERRKREETERLARERLIRADIRTHATALGFANPAIAHRLVDVDAVTFDDAGEPTNIEALLKEVAKAEPYLIKQANGTGAHIPPTGRPTNGAGLSEQQRKAAQEQASGFYQRTF